MADDKKALMRELLIIYNLNSSISIGSSDSLKAVLDAMDSNHYFSTAVGKKFHKRIRDIHDVNPFETVCVVCGKPCDGDVPTICRKCNQSLRSAHEKQSKTNGGEAQKMEYRTQGYAGSGQGNYQQGMTPNAMQQNISPSNIQLSNTQTTMTVKGRPFWAIILFIAAVIFFIASFNMYQNGSYKMNRYYNPDSGYGGINAYVGGDAYNYIINGNYATGYYVLSMGFLISGVLCGAFGVVILSFSPRNDKIATRKVGKRQPPSSSSKNNPGGTPPVFMGF